MKSGEEDASRGRASVLLCALLLSLSLTPSDGLAHGGRTDSSGGHYNRSTGEYHFHHGYSAHQHPGGSCVYGFVDKTGANSGSGGTATAAPTRQPTSRPTVRPTVRPTATPAASPDASLGVAVSVIIGVAVVSIMIAALRSDRKKKN